MNMHDPLPTTPDEFLRWNAYREGKREFVKGQVVEMMINVTQKHYQLASQMLRQLLTSIADDGLIAGMADFGVKTPDGIRYPDVMVHRAGDGDDLATDHPVLICEVISKSSIHIDMGPKAQEYLQIESLKHYLILSQDEPAAWLWSRDGEGAFGDPAVITDRKSVIDLTSLGVTVAMADIYRGIA